MQLAIAVLLDLWQMAQKDEEFLQIGKLGRNRKVAEGLQKSREVWQILTNDL